MKKHNFLSKALFTVALLLSCTPVIAIPQDPCIPIDVCCEEPTSGPFAFSYPKDVGLSCPRDFYVHGEFLYIKPIEDGLEYAIEQDKQADFSSDPQIRFPLISGKVKGFSKNSDEWDWRYGFRVGIGSYAIRNSWNIQADWTYIKIKSDSEISNGGTGVLLPLFRSPSSLSPTAATFQLSNASSRWSGDYNTFDLMIGKSYHVSRYYVSNPKFGIRTTWINQDYHIRYFEGAFETPNPSTAEPIQKRNVFLKNDYWGAGLRGLYEGEFLLGSGFNIYGKTAFSLLFGKFDITQSFEEIIDLAAAGTNNLSYQTENSFYCVLPNAEISIGILWSKFYFKNQYQVSLKVGYEFHHWWDQNQSRRFFDTDPTANDTASRGDLSFNGFMFGLHLEF